MSANRTPARPRGRRTQPSTLGWIALIVFMFLAGVGAIGALTAIGLYTSLAADLPDPRTLENIPIAEESIVYDRTGKVELARFGSSHRELVTFDQIPKVLLDATTAVEDKTFWENAGFDPVAIGSAALSSIRGDSRGASTITQQLVRARLLDPSLVKDPHRTAERKLKEIIQSIRLTNAYQGEEGKQTIITAYLNQNYYGNQSYGVKAAVDSYFGIDLSKITPSQAAIIAGLPKSPSNYDLVRNAIDECSVTVAEGEECPRGKQLLVVPDDTAVVQRRDLILDLLAQGRTPESGNQYSPAELEAAKSDDVVLSSQASPRWVAPHFVWAVRDELTAKLCGPEAETCTAMENGGLRVTTTLDTRLQKTAEKWVQAAAIVPHAKNPGAAAKALGFKDVQPWMTNLRSKNLRNSALVALDYQTGELVAYVGSANYYASSNRAEFQPQYDVVGKGFRQPGSAFKPFNYAVAINDRKLTAGSMLMDVGTTFAGDYSPTDADNLERGPVRVRNALQFSLNIPAVKAMGINGPDNVFAKAEEFGMDFQGDRTADLALALGVQEVRPVDLVTAYGTLANGGKAIGHTTILTIKDASGRDVVDPYQPPAGKQVITPQSAWIVTDILAGNTNKNVNPFWGKFAINGPDGRRAATLKTGTNNDAKDLNAYGYIAPPTAAGRDDGAYALAVGVWNGNSDNSLVSTPAKPVFSIDVSTYVWQGFLTEASRNWPETNFARPDGLVKAAIDPFTGLLAGPGSKSVDEWFIAGTEPHESLSGDTCGVDVVVRLGYEKDHDDWMTANRDWIRRAQRGPGVVGGPDKTKTAYFYNGAFQPFGNTWGAVVAVRCGQATPVPAATCYFVPTPDPSGVVPSFEVPVPSGSGPAPVPCPTASPEPSASPSESPSPSVEPSPTPSETPSEAPPSEPPPTATPTPTPTPTPTYAYPNPDSDSDTHSNTAADSEPVGGCCGGAAEPIRTNARAVTSPDGDGPALGAGDDSAAVIDLHGVTVRRGGRAILGPLDWAVGRGERWVVIGPNGSGKTTLLSIAGLTLWPTTGTVDVLGARYGRIDSREVRRRIGAAGTAVESILRDDLTPVVLVMTARHAATEPWWHVYTDLDRDRASGLLDGLGLGAVKDHAYGTLSAGERRRVSIARALMPDPDLLLLDEPAANLDLGARETLIRDLASLAATPRPAAIVLVTHHVEEIPPGFDHALVLADGAAVAAGPLDAVLGGGALGRAYGLPIVVERRDGRTWARLA